MKALVTAIMLAFAAVAVQAAVQAAEPAKKEDVKAVQNDNCVKKDKKGNCPPPPKSPKPTPKKKAEEKK